MTLNDPKSDNSDIWQVDLARGAWSRLTFGPKTTVSAAPSPDGAWLYFASNRDGRMGLYRRRLNGAGTDEDLLKGTIDTYPDFVTPDGTSLVYETVNAKMRNEIWRLPLGGDRKPVVLVSMASSSVAHAAISPDGRYFAYASDETGRPEIYIQPFPPTGAKWQVSTGGGDQPQFRPDGREIFFVSADRKMTAASLAAGKDLEVGIPTALFPLRAPANSMSDFRSQYVPAPDGRRFLALLRRTSTTTAPAVVTLCALGEAP